MCDPQLEHLIYYSSRVGDVKIRLVFHPPAGQLHFKKKDAKASENFLNRNNIRLSNPLAEMPIFQPSIIFGVYVRLGTLRTHKTVARFAQGWAVLYH